MTALPRVLGAEALKLRRTLALRLALAAPLLEVGLLFTVGLVRPQVVFRDTNLVPQFVRPIMTLWTIILLPSVVAIVAALVAGLDHDEHHWDQIFALPIGRGAVYGAKWVAASALIALSSLTLLASGITAMALLRKLVPRLHASALPARTLAAFVWRSDAASLLLISVLFWCSLRFRSFVAPLALGAIGIVSTIVLINAPGRLVAFWPWMAPVLAAPGRLPVALTLCSGAGILAALAACWQLSRRMA